MFEQHYEPVCRDSPRWGRIAPIPWDIETFGFGVADYEIDDSNASLQYSPRIKEYIKSWAKAHQIELVGARVPAPNIRKLYFFQSLGFNYIDTTLLLRYDRVQSATYRPLKIALTPATEDELEPVVQICGKAFQNGRYHADARIPRHLANRRYQDWARRTFEPENPQILLVARTNGDVCAFSIVQVNGERGHLHLNAVAPQWQGKQVGVGLIASTLRYFQQQGVSYVVAKISAANTPAMNLHSFFGARFYDPQILLHWHAPWATHLVPVEK